MVKTVENKKLAGFRRPANLRRHLLHIISSFQHAPSLEIKIQGPIGKRIARYSAHSHYERVGAMEIDARNCATSSAEFRHR